MVDIRRTNHLLEVRYGNRTDVQRIIIRVPFHYWTSYKLLLQLDREMSVVYTSGTFGTGA